MRTVKWNPLLSGTCMFLGGVLLWAGAVRADVSTTNSAAILVYPKLLVDTTAATGKAQLDTVIELTNTSTDPVNVRCFLVNANGHCSISPFAICDPDQAGAPGFAPPGETCGKCIPSWVETDFSLRLTSKQPIVWTASDGLVALPLDPNFTDNIPGNGQFNTGSIPPAPEIPFRGELKCIEVGDDESPVAKNDLKGEATLEVFNQTATTDFPLADIEGYNAIGIQAIPGDNFNADNTLVIGQEYNSCPNLLILDHFFDDAPNPTADTSSRVRTRLTLVPCSEDFNFQAPNTTVVQYLVYNEFEQRFSTSNRVTCFSELHLSDIDTHLGAGDDKQSIFNFSVEGTLTGQTVIRGVSDSNTTSGHGLLGIAEEGHFTPVAGSAAFNLHQRGTRTQNDIIELPGVPTTSTP